MSIEYASGVDIGERKRKQDGVNEDSIAVNLLEDSHLDTERNVGVFVLADGAGGEAAGRVASYIATVEVTRELTQALWESWRFNENVESATDEERLKDAVLIAPLYNKSPGWVVNRIETAIRSTHTRILQRVQELGLGKAYTTVIAGVKIGDRLYYGWVGDSRAYVVNCHPKREANSRLSLLTRDHSIVQRLREQSEIDEVEAHVHRKGNRITRALGGMAEEDPVESTIQVETNHVRLFADDIVLFTSDGLIDAYADASKLHEQYLRADSKADIASKILEKSVTDDEIRDVIVDADSLSVAVDRLIDLANRRGGKDNLSLILFRDEGLPTSPTDGLPDRSYEPTPDQVHRKETVIRDNEYD